MYTTFSQFYIESMHLCTDKCTDKEIISNPIFIEEWFKLTKGTN